mgnify:FL=1
MVGGTALTSCSGMGGDLYTTIINLADCTESGMYLEGSDMEFKGRVNTYLNAGDGILARRSQLRLTQITANNNSGWGINLDGSQLTYGINSDSFAIRPDDYGNTNIKSAGRVPGGILPTGGSFALYPAADTGKRVRNRAQFHVDSNNQTILVDRSSALTPATMNNIPRYMGRFGGCNWLHTTGDDKSIGTCVEFTPGTHFGATPYRVNNLPGVVVTNGSNAEIVNMNYAVDSGDSGKGKVAIASNGSNITFRGTSGTTTTFNYYPLNSQAALFRSWLSAGVAATNNSNIEFTGPTKSARFGVPFLAEANSNCSFNPPTLVGTDNILDISGYHLIEGGSVMASSNHTSVEVQSTRAAMVANKKSGLNLYGLGGRVVADDTDTVLLSTDVLATGYADAFLGDSNSQWTKSTSGGYVKFYPHGFTSGVFTEYPTRLAMAGTNPTSFDSSLRYLAAPANVDAHRTNMTGGMCVRAVQDSSVNVNLVNFMYNASPSSVSGAYYNLRGTGCEQGSDVVPDEGPKNTDGWTRIGDDPNPEDTGADELDGGGVPPPGGTGANNNWSQSIITGGTNGVGAVGTGAGFGIGEMQQPAAGLYSAAGLGNRGGLAASFPDNENPAAMSVIGDERAPIQAGGTYKGSLQKYRFAAYLRDKANNTQSVDLTRHPNCMGSQIQIWNIADTSRIHASNILANGYDPLTWSLSGLGGSEPGSNCHGPFGKWWNGVSLDYFGLGGRRSTYGGCGASYYNCGVFRLILSTRGDLKSFYDVSTLSGTYTSWPATGGTAANGWRGTALSGGSPVDQVNGEGYTHWTQNVRVLGSADTRRLTATDSDFPSGLYQLSSCLRVFGWGMPTNYTDQGVATMQPRLGGFSAYNATSGLAGQPSGAWIYTTAEPATPLPPLGMDSLGYMRNWFDETASNMWQNVKHLAEDKVNGVSIYRSNYGGTGGGEGRDCNQLEGSYGVGVRSLNMFDLERLL